MFRDQIRAPVEFYGLASRNKSAELQTARGPILRGPTGATNAYQECSVTKYIRLNGRAVSGQNIRAVIDVFGAVTTRNRQVYKRAWCDGRIVSVAAMARWMRPSGVEIEWRCVRRTAPSESASADAVGGPRYAGANTSSCAADACVVGGAANCASRCSTGTTRSANRRMFSSASWCGMPP